MTHLKSNNNDSGIKDGFAERIFDFPRLYRFKIGMVKTVVSFIRPLILKDFPSSIDSVLYDIIPDGSSVFEIGCGDGELHRKLTANHKNLKYAGTDINPQMIDYCRVNYPGAEWHVSGTPPYKYPDASFDFCIIENVLHHVDNYETICYILRDAMRIAKRVILFETLQSDNRLLYHMKSVYWRVTDGGKFYLTYSEFQKLFKDAGAKLEWERVSKPLHQIYCCELGPNYFETINKSSVFSL